MYNNYGPPQQPYHTAQQFQPPYETQGIHFPQNNESPWNSQLQQSYSSHSAAQQPYSPNPQQEYNNQDFHQQQQPHGQPSSYGLPPALQPYNPPSQPPHNSPLKPPQLPSYDDKSPNDPRQYTDNKRQHASPPNQHDSPVAAQSKAAPVPPQQPITFHFSGTAREKSILATTVTDPWGRVVLSVSSPSKKQSIVSDGEGRVVVTFDWDHSSPIMVYRGQKMKTREWLPYQKKPTKRFVMHHNGQPFNWTDIPNGDTILSHETAPGRPLAVSPELGGHVQIQVFPEALSQGMLEPILLATFLMACKKPFGDGGGSSTMTGIAVAAFTFL